MHSKPFLFKKFIINQDQCAMKVGTDAILLGAWANISHNPYSILDIGAGTGILSLMLAQRCYAEQIDAIEIEDNAYEQCVNNFENSTWSDRLFCYHASLEEFVDEIDDTYDLIISNPPFYTEDYKSSKYTRDLARFEDAMPFEHLVESVSKLLSKNGKLVVVIPFKEETPFITLASKKHLFPNKFLRVKGNSETPFKRSLIEFSFDKKEMVVEELTIETSRHVYTQNYTNLTKDFYLKM